MGWSQGLKLHMQALACSHGPLFAEVFFEEQNYCLAQHVDLHPIGRGDTAYLDEEALNPEGDHQQQQSIPHHRYQQGKSHPNSILLLMHGLPHLCQ